MWLAMRHGIIQSLDATKRIGIKALLSGQGKWKKKNMAAMYSVFFVVLAAYFQGKFCR